MEELIKKVSEKIGVSEDAARKAVIIVADYLIAKLPAPFAAQIDALLNLPDVDEEEASELGLFKIP